MRTPPQEGFITIALLQYMKSVKTKPNNHVKKFVSLHLLNQFPYGSIQSSEGVCGPSS